MKRLWLSILVLLVATLAGCASPKSKAPIQEFTIRGEVVRLDAGQRIATIRHEKIEGWMEPMTMDFPVREGEDLGNLQPGKHIQGTVYVQGYDFTIGNVTLRPTGK